METLGVFVGLGMNLTAVQKRILRAIAAGATLKAHRSLDGEKLYRLHYLAGEIEKVGDAAVANLEEQQLLHSNQKFPAATFLLTDRGRKAAADLVGEEVKPLGARNF